MLKEPVKLIWSSDNYRIFWVFHIKNVYLFQPKYFCKSYLSASTQSALSSTDIFKRENKSFVCSWFFECPPNIYIYKNLNPPIFISLWYEIYNLSKQKNFIWVYSHNARYSKAFELSSFNLFSLLDFTENLKMFLFASLSLIISNWKFSNEIFGISFVKLFD